MWASIIPSGGGKVSWGAAGERPWLVAPRSYHCWQSFIRPWFPQEKPKDVPSRPQRASLHRIRPLHLGLCQSHMGSPSQKGHLCPRERVNRRAARYVIGDYHRLSSVSGMLWSLGWSTLEDLRREARLTLFYKIVKGEIAVSLEDVHLELAGRRTRSTHKFKYKALPPATYQILSPTRLLRTGTHYQLLWWMRTQAAASSLASHVWGRRLSKPHVPSLSPHRYIILPEEVNRAIILWDWDWDCNSVILHL